MMNKFLHKLIAPAVLLLLISNQLKAVDLGVGVTLINYTLGTVDLGYTITINARVSNYDSVPFNGTLDFGLRNNQQELSNSGVFNKPPYSSTQISLGPYETVPAVFSVDIDPQFFNPGPDVVVVWPICGKPIIDSIVININVLTPNSIADNKDDLFTFIVLGNKIFLKNYAPETNFKQVRIYNLMGQQVSELHSQFITEVPLPVLPKGLYLCEFLSADGKRKVIRFFY